jgi:hypothetical protein
VPLLAPQETVTLTRSIVVGPGSAPRNVGTVNALDPLAKPVTASDDAFINIVLGETIEKTPPVVPVVAPAELPRTGGDFRGITLAGFILAGMGAILMLADRRLRSLYVTTSGTHVVGDVAEQRSDGLLARMGAGVVATMALIAVLFRRSGRR